MLIAIGTRAHWKQVKHLYPKYKFYHELGVIPPRADKILLVTSSQAVLPRIECHEAYYIPEREYGKAVPVAMPIDISKPRLTKMEFHLADHCNLSCDMCNHYCNLEKDESFPNIECVKKDLMRLKELYWGVGIICLVGGEPFLNPELDKYCDLVRNIFPDSDIEVITNGILIPKLKKLPEFLDSMEKNEIRLVITRYPITERLMNKIQERLKDSKVNISYTYKIETFAKKLTKQPSNNRKLSYKLCHEKECHFLNNGKIYGCTVFGRIKKLNKEFGCNYPDVGLDIYTYKNGWELNNKLENEFPFCAYCSVSYENQPWTHGGKTTLDTWIVHNPDKKTALRWCYNIKDKIKKRLS